MTYPSSSKVVLTPKSMLSMPLKINTSNEPEKIIWGYTWEALNSEPAATFIKN